MTGRLPAGFEELEPFVEEWDLPTFNARRAYRGGRSMEEIRRFYDAMVPRASDALALVDGHAFPDLPEDVARLYRLLLALNHAAMAIEVHGAPRAPYAPYPDQLTVTRSFATFG
ncbi:hypothetical protein [Sphingomonas sp. ID0503]|uniref:hypothetical protein n=1 Tax=Sphingomonas sp. ID0503 TaxID=3399691 RepID=UPI003AFB5027